MIGLAARQQSGVLKYYALRWQTHPYAYNAASYSQPEPLIYSVSLIVQHEFTTRLT